MTFDFFVLLWVCFLFLICFALFCFSQLCSTEDLKYELASCGMSIEEKAIVGVHILSDMSLKLGCLDVDTYIWKSSYILNVL